MSTVTIPNLPSAGALTGTEVLPIVQSNVTSKTTTQDIATLAGAVVTLGGAPGSTIRINNSNIASGYFSTVSGGVNNKACNTNSTVGGGINNISSGLNASIGGGGCNTVSKGCSTISGGNSNSVSSYHSVISGGLLNTITANQSVIGGGYKNTNSGYRGVIAGGYNNGISNTTQNSSILGGQSNCNIHCNAMIVGSCITSIMDCTTHVNCLAIINVPTSALGLCPGMVWKKLDGSLQIV